MQPAVVLSIDDLRIQRIVGRFTAEQLLMYRVACAKVGTSVVHEALTTTTLTIDDLFKYMAEKLEETAYARQTKDH